MTKTLSAKPSDIEKRWVLIDAEGLVLGRLGFENAYGLAVTQATAREYDLASIADLARVAPQLTIGGDPEWFERPEWEAVRQAYGLRFADRRTYSPTFMYNALTSGEADVISAYTSDGRIAAHNLVVLQDPLEALPSYDAIVLVSPRMADNAGLVEALQPLLGAVDVQTMRQANYAVDREEDKWSPAQAAAWLLRAIRR